MPEMGEAAIKTEPGTEDNVDALKEEPLIAPEKEPPSSEDKSERAFEKDEDVEPDNKVQDKRRKSSPESSRAVFVGNFPPTFSSDDIEDLFTKHGKVSRVDKKQNFAFVFMPNSEDAEAAIDDLCGKSIGRPPRTLRVEWSRGDGEYHAFFFLLCVFISCCVSILTVSLCQMFVLVYLHKVLFVVVRLHVGLGTCLRTRLSSSLTTTQRRWFRGTLKIFSRPMAVS